MDTGTKRPGRVAVGLASVLLFFAAGGAVILPLVTGEADSPFRDAVQLDTGRNDDDLVAEAEAAGEHVDRVARLTDRAHQAMNEAIWGPGPWSSRIRGASDPVAAACDAMTSAAAAANTEMFYTPDTRARVAEVRDHACALGTPGGPTREALHDELVVLFYELVGRDLH